jgi:phosphatidylserine/phosphatidylglycerophosphate/cardiolipin synthase-like enzyme
MKFLKKMVREFNWLFVILLVLGCANVLALRQIPEIILGEETFFPTIEAYTEAPIAGGNRIEVLLNGDETFPSILREIRSAKSTITFAHYFYEDGSIAHELAQAFAERCRAGVKVDILLDSLGANKAPSDIIATMKDAGCQMEYFHRVEAEGIIFPWKLLRYNYRSHCLAEVFQEDLKYSKQVAYEEWQSRGIFERFFELFAFPIKEQL